MCVCVRERERGIHLCFVFAGDPVFDKISIAVDLIKSDVLFIMGHIENKIFLSVLLN